MKQKFPLFAAFFVLAILLWTACTRTSPFGADLLDDQLADYDFTDTLTIRCSIEREDSLVTSDRISTAAYFLCGDMTDPYFGKTKADIYALFQPSVPTALESTLRFDSIILFMRYGNTGLYGDTMQPQNIVVQRVDEGYSIGATTVYYCTSSLPASTEIGRLDNFVPHPGDQDSLFSTTARGAYIKIPLDPNFGRELMAFDSATLAEDSVFYQKLRGIKITSTSSGATPGLILPLNLNDQNFSRIRLYYTRQDTIHGTFDYFFQGSNKFSSFKHDYSGSVVGAQIENSNDNLLYLQGAEGVKVKIEFPYVDQLENIAVNEADLLLTVNDQLANDLPGLLKPATQLVLSRSVGDTIFDVTSDVSNSINSLNNYSRFGGAPNKETEPGGIVTRYHLNMSDYLQGLVDLPAGSDIKKKTVYLNLNLQSRTAMRSILYGPGSTTYPAKLLLKYSRVK